MSRPSSSDGVVTMPFSVPQLEPLFDVLALIGCDAAVMRPHQGFAGKIIDRAADAFGQAAAVDEDERRGTRTHQFHQLGMNGAPDRWPNRTLRCRTAGNGLDLIQAGHVVQQWNFDAKIQFLGRARIHNCHRTM